MKWVKAFALLLMLATAASGTAHAQERRGNRERKGGTSEKERGTASGAKDRMRPNWGAQAKSLGERFGDVAARERPAATGGAGRGGGGREVRAGGEMPPRDPKRISPEFNKAAGAEAPKKETPKTDKGDPPPTPRPRPPTFKY